jgi:sn-glycerol 3-phosphate transport system permease protein
MSFYARIRPYAMVAPSILIFLFFFIYPIFYMIYLSMHKWNFISPDKTFVGTDNFKDLFSDSEFLQVIRNTFSYTLFTVSLTIVLALLIALWVNRQGTLYSVVQGLIFSPHIVSLVSVSMLWMWIMDPQYGLLNWLLGSVGLPELQWLSDPKTSLFSLVIVAIWKSVGFNTLVFIAGLQSISSQIYEAAALDDASRWRTFYKLTLPMLSPTLFFLVITNLIGSFQVFETISIMTDGGPVNSTSTLVFYIYQYGFRFFKIGYASSAGAILLVVIGLLTILYFKLLSRKVHYR